MSLKAFHIFFIALATLMSLACGVWALKAYGALIEKAMSASTPEQCELIGAHMLRVADALKE